MFSAVSTNQNSALPPLNMLMLCSASQPLRITLKHKNYHNVTQVTSDYSVQLQIKLHHEQINLLWDDHCNTHCDMDYTSYCSTTSGVNSLLDAAFHTTAKLLPVARLNNNLACDVLLKTQYV